MPIRCPYCGNQDWSLLEVLSSSTDIILCVVCSRKFKIEIVELGEKEKEDRRKNDNSSNM